MAATGSNSSGSEKNDYVATGGALLCLSVLLVFRSFDLDIKPPSPAYPSRPLRVVVATMWSAFLAVCNAPINRNLAIVLLSDSIIGEIGSSYLSFRTLREESCWQQERHTESLASLRSLVAFAPSG